MTIRSTSIRLLSVTLALSCFLLLQHGTIAESCGPHSSPPSISPCTALQGGVSSPRQVLIIRHAEKPDDKNDPHLTSRGAARAAALPSLFFIPKQFRTKPGRFATPDFIYATAESKHSNRPVETVRPLAKVLGDMEIHAKHSDDDYQPVVDHLFQAKHANKTVLVCWHHGKIPALARAVLARAKNGAMIEKQIPKKWDDAVFDRVWQFAFDEQGSAAFEDRPQSLLFKDHDR